MQKFTTKAYKDTWEYEICNYPYSDTWQYLKITQYHKGQYCGEESIDLSEINPEFSEIQAPKVSVSMLIIPYIGGGLFTVVFLAVLLSLIFDKNTILSASMLAVPIGVVWYYVDNILKRIKNLPVSEFVFDNKDSGVFTIPYEPARRTEALEIAQKIAVYCNQTLVEEEAVEPVRHQFANGLAELRTEEIVLFNQDGIKCAYCDYGWAVPGIHHHVEKHYIRNFFSILFAALFYIGSLVLIAGVIFIAKDWAMAVSFGVLYVIPFILGCYFLSLRKKSLDCYYAGNRFDEENWGIYLEVGKHPGSEKIFIEELNRRLRKAHNECQ